MTAALPMTVEEMLAREAIRHTMAVYNTSGDRGRLEELAATFTQDGVLDVGSRRFAGRTAIAAGLAGGIEARRTGAAPPSSFVRHHLTTSRLELSSPTEAEGWTYFVVFSDTGADHTGTYVDRFRCEDGRWLIAHRRVKIHWDSPDTLLHGPTRDR